MSQVFVALESTIAKHEGAVEYSRLIGWRSAIVRVDAYVGQAEA